MTIAQLLAPSTPLLPTGTGTITLNADTPLGMLQIMGTDTQLMINLLYLMMHDLQAKVDVLTERSKNTGIIFNRHAFASEAEFTLCPLVCEQESLRRRTRGHH
jgi:hypothetical protein